MEGLLAVAALVLDRASELELSEDPALAEAYVEERWEQFLDAVMDRLVCRSRPDRHLGSQARERSWPAITDPAKRPRSVQFLVEPSRSEQMRS